ncbi:hypothetical protein [Variovorax sp. 160MFSha2.1]|uniref:hypothetical protein n=1 Tax=Variovorax sp. 160MFSha2.1 TaxID=3158367 RepID=UPI003AB0896A
MTPNPQIPAGEDCMLGDTSQAPKSGIKPVSITICISEEADTDSVIVICNGKVTQASVKREEYVESRWGRYYNAKQRAQHIVAEAVRDWVHGVQA